MDLALTGNGVVITDHWMAVPLEGTFHPENIPEPITKALNSMPLYREDGNIVQIFFSEYSLNTILTSVIELNWFNYTMVQTSDNVDAIIDDFEYSFGEFEECEVIVMPTINYDGLGPVIKIDPTGSHIEVIIEIHYKNPINPEIDAALVIAKASGDVVFEVGNDFKLYGQTEQVTLHVLDFEPYFLSRATTKQINSKIVLIAPFISSYINNLLDKGMELPLPKNITQHIKN